MNKPTPGYASLTFTREEMQTLLFRKFVHAIEEERQILRQQLEDVSNIETTTLLRGELRGVKKILARTSEVGPESRQSDPNGAEFANSPLR